MFQRVITLIQAYENGILDRQVKKEDSSGGAIKFPIYHLRCFGEWMSASVAKTILDMAIDKELPPVQLDQTARNTQLLQNIQAGIMGEIFSSEDEVKTWEEIGRRFPQHSGMIFCDTNVAK